MNDVIIWYRKEGNSYMVGEVRADASQLPRYSVPVTRCQRCDSQLMMQWIVQQLYAGKTIKEISQMCL